jgi:hypothetical protein
VRNTSAAHNSSFFDDKRQIQQWAASHDLKLDAPSESPESLSIWSSLRAETCPIRTCAVTWSCMLINREVAARHRELLRVREKGAGVSGSHEGQIVLLSRQYGTHWAGGESCSSFSDSRDTWGSSGRSSSMGGGGKRQID